MNDSVFLQCTDDVCGLRFPGPLGFACPRCRGNTAQVAARYPNVALRRAPLREVALLLDNVRSAHNVGSILRTAESVGASYVYLAGITPAATNPKVAKAALGSEQRVSTSHHLNAVALATELRAGGATLIALESCGRAVDFLLHAPAIAAAATRPVLVVGSEVAGVDPGVLAICQHVLAIPMTGDKNSLNVGHALAIAAYAFARPA